MLTCHQISQITPKRFQVKILSLHTFCIRLFSSVCWRHIYYRTTNKCIHSLYISLHTHTHTPHTHTHIHTPTHTHIILFNTYKFYRIFQVINLSKKIYLHSFYSANLAGIKGLIKKVRNTVTGQAKIKSGTVA